MSEKKDPFKSNPEADRAVRARALAKEVDRYVSAQIRKARLAAGVTQQELAAALGLSYQQVQKYENGANRISAGRLYVLAQLLGRDLTDFFPPSPGSRQPVEAVGPLAVLGEDAVAMARDLMALDNPQLRRAVRSLLRALRRESEPAEDA